MRYTTENLPDWSGIKSDEGVSIKPVFGLLNEKGKIFRTYYQIRDVYQTYVERALSSLQIYEEFNARMDKEKLVAIFTAQINECNKKEVKLANIIDLANKALERINWVVPHNDLVRRLAANAYFDETESPYKVDHSYQNEKIKLWEKHNVDDFFLYRTISDLVAIPKLSQETYEAYQRVLTQLDEILNQKLEQVSLND